MARFALSNMPRAVSVPVDGSSVGRDVVQLAGMRIAFLGHQPDIHGHVLDVSGLDAALCQRRLDPQYLLLADRERGVNRIELHDGGELGRPADADETAHVKPDAR